MKITVPCINCKRNVEVDWKPEESLVAPSYGLHRGCGDTTASVPTETKVWTNLETDTPVTTAASERPNTDTTAVENALAAQLEGSDGK